MAILGLSFVAAVLAMACGKKGPPLPPLIRIPAPPADFTAVRRGTEVDLQFTVPNANTDGTRPANVERMDVYAFSGPSSVAGAAAASPLSNDQLLKLATKIRSVPVKAPRDPNLAIEPDEPSDDIEQPEGRGVDQGTIARVDEQLTAASQNAIDLPLNEKTAGTVLKSRRFSAASQPLLGMSGSLVRTYAIVGVTPRGRRGPVSKRVSVPLTPPPPPPAPAKIEYDETTITITWSSPFAPAQVLNVSGENVLPARTIGADAPKLTYNVYEAAIPPDGTDPVETRLTPSPIVETTFTDRRIVWGVERCYVVRTVESVGGLAVESDPPPLACRKLVDTFPPAAPKGLRTVPGQGSVSLIWEPNGEKDLAGYVVLRGVQPDALEPITPEPIKDATFTDNVPAGVLYFYAVKAVDKSGNLSPVSNRDEGTARE